MQGQYSKSDCYHCGESFTEGYNREYCSHECKYRQKGEKALNLLRNTHTHCSTCGRTLKEIDEPPSKWQSRKRDLEQHCLDNGANFHTVDGILALDTTQVSQDGRTSADIVIGFQYTTNDAIEVEKQRKSLTNEIVGMGTGCKCGQTDPSTVDKDLRDIELAAALGNYVIALRKFYEEGQLDQRIDKELFFETYKDSRDIEYSLGVALHST